MSDDGRSPGGVVDLRGRTPMTPDKIAEAQKQAELQAGMRCRGCERRISFGFEFVLIRLAPADSGPQRMQVLRTYACSREDCDFAQKQRGTATAMKMIEWAWFEESNAPKAQARTTATVTPMDD